MTHDKMHKMKIRVYEATFFMKTCVLGMAQHENMTTILKVVAHLWTSMVRNCPCFPVKNLDGAACALN
jgi:hypothetical protein